jgi:hypothetical protein
MITFVESLKRLYNTQRIDLARLDELLASGKINQTEYDYIINV